MKLATQLYALKKKEHLRAYIAKIHKKICFEESFRAQKKMFEHQWTIDGFLQLFSKKKLWKNIFF